MERSLAAMVMLVEQLVTHADTLNFGDLQPCVLHANAHPTLSLKPYLNAPGPRPGPL